MQTKALLPISSILLALSTSAAAQSLHFVPVTPCRLADTRSTSIIAGGVARSFTIPQLGCSIPATAQAYSLNVTAVPAGSLGYLTIWPTGQSQPNVSTLNSWEGIVVANAAIVPAGTNGAVSVYASDPSNVILDINGYFDTSTGPTSYSFYPATPCRVVDTRWAAGQFGGPEMNSATPRDFPIPLSACPIPATARGYSLNFTVVPSGDLSYLTTWPTGQPQPNVSTLNSWTGKVVANAAIVPAGTNESVSVFVTDPTQVILDINGYFGAPGNTGALTFYPVPPCRVADTRRAAGAFGGPEMEGPATRSFAIPASGCNIPSTAAAYSLNITVVPDGYLSYLTIWPDGGSQPNVSTLNSWDGSVVANAAIVPAGSNGAIDVYVTNPTQVIIDIDGYFAPEGSGVAPNPVPSIASVSPTSVPAGTSQMTLTINGTGFTASSAVTFNGAPHTPTLINSAQLTITLTASDLATVGTYSVVVTNPPPGGGLSTAASFGVTAAGIAIQGKSFTVNATVTIENQALGTEIIGTPYMDQNGTYALNVYDVDTPGVSVLFTFLQGLVPSISGNTVVFDGPATESLYYDSIASPSEEATITSATVTLTFTSLSVGSPVSGTLKMVTTEGTIQSALTGTLASVVSY